MIAINQASTANRPHFVEDETHIWSARPDGGGSDRYLALFNAGDTPRPVGIAFGELGLGGSVQVRDLWTGVTDRATRRIERHLPPHGTTLLRLSV
ncbi:MAG TPA: hypothetical protein VGC28_08175 [Sphingomonas sp.]